MRIPIYFCGSIPMQDIADALHGVGIHIRTEAGHRLVAERVPAFVRKDQPNVVPMKRTANSRKPT